LKILKKNKAPGKKIKTTAEKRKQMSGHSIREEKMIEPVLGTMDCTLDENSWQAG